MRSASVEVGKPQRPQFSLALYAFVWVALVFTAVVFYLDEYKRVIARLELVPLRQAYIPVSCEASPENDGRIIHIDCPLRKLHTFYPPAEFSWNLKPFRGVFLDMKVEMFQWVLRSKPYGLAFEGAWTSNLVDSSNYPIFLRNTHVNPDFFPNINGAGRRFAPQVYAGDYALTRRHIVGFHQKKQLPLEKDHFYVKPQERPPTTVSYANTQVYQDALFTGDPLRPQIGDLRITFWGSSATHASAMGQQQRRRRAQFALDDVELTSFVEGSSNRTVRELVFEGDHTAEEMFQLHLNNRADTSVWGKGACRILLWFLATSVVALTTRGLQTPEELTAPLPLFLGSGCFAGGVLLLSLVPLWLLCDSSFGIVLGFSGVTLFSLGFFIWKLGRQSVAGDGGVERNDNNLPIPLLSAAQQGDNASPFTVHNHTNGKTRHVYQPV